MIPEPERLTHDYDGELVVFLIGMRINRWSHLRAWWPTFTAMPPMIRELMSDPESGAVGYRVFGLPRTPTVLLYWTSLEKLYAYASDPDAKHRPAWAAFNRRARTAGASVGIWHETFVVERAETFYYAMPPTGLAAATAAQPVSVKRARDRMAAGRTAT